MKKMRRLIPAIAMLLVSAVMLSTASFAWFTMSKDVTATGMQIQAQADSSLVISEAPLTYDTGKASVDFASAVRKLVPMTYGSYQTTDAAGTPTTNKGWVVPTNTAGINSTTGAMVEGDVYKSANAAEGTNYIEKCIYIASAGAEMPNKKLEITLKAPVVAAGETHKAYAAAIYVVTDTTKEEWKPDKTVAVDAEPVARVYVDTADNRNVVTLDGPYTIPSIVGVGEQDDKTTGIKVIIRFYVDGDLTSVGTGEGYQDKVITGYTYTPATGKWVDTTMYYVLASTTYEAATGVTAENVTNYFVDDGEGNYEAATEYAEGTTYYAEKKTYKPAVVTPDMVSGTTNVPNGWYTRSAVEEWFNYRYVRTDDVPTAASQLEIMFTAK